MSSKNDTEYEALKRFLGWTYENVGFAVDAPPEVHPILVLEKAEQSGMVPRSKLKEGLKAAVRDMLEFLSRCTEEQTKVIDEALKKIGAPTLTEMRMAFSKDLNRIEKRGHIETEEEFYLVRNVLSFPMIEFNPKRANKLVEMLSKFEGA